MSGRSPSRPVVRIFRVQGSDSFFETNIYSLLLVEVSQFFALTLFTVSVNVEFLVLSPSIILYVLRFKKNDNLRFNYKKYIFICHSSLAAKIIINTENSE